MLTNIPSPYRIPVTNLLAEKYEHNFAVVYSAYTEPNRKWLVEGMRHEFVVLKGKVFRVKDRYVHLSYGILAQLIKKRPGIIINGGLSFTNIAAWLYSRIFRTKHIVIFDSWSLPERRLTPVHRLVRRVIFPHSDALVCVGSKGFDYFRSFGVPASKIFLSPLSIDNGTYSNHTTSEKKYDLMFSGQFVESKLPFFVVEVLRKLVETNTHIRLLMLGSGELEEQIISRLKQLEIEYEFPGFVQQSELPKYYASAKILLFPTQYDAWGIVANEAMAAGVPVITCDNAGAANDLVVHGVNGYVLPLDVDVWTRHILELLTNKEQYEVFSAKALEKVSEYTCGKSVQGIISAISFVTKGGSTELVTEGKESSIPQAHL